MSLMEERTFLFVRESLVDGRLSVGKYRRKYITVGEMQILARDAFEEINERANEDVAVRDRDVSTVFNVYF